MDTLPAQPVQPNTDGQPSVLPVQDSKQSFFKKKFIFLLFGALLLLIPLFIIFSSPATAPSKQAANTILVPSVTSTAITDQGSNMNETEIAVVKTQAKPQLDKVIEVTYEISKVKLYGDNWALLAVSNPETSPANVVMEKKGNQWTLIMGPGTYFDPDALKEKGAPKELVEASNSNF